MEENSTKKKRNRSAAYPATTLEQAIDIVKMLRTNLGSGPYSSDSAGKALGHTGLTGASAVKIASCVQYGLLVREGNTYKQSDLANEIFTPQSEQEKVDAIKRALHSPTLYSKLITAYSAQSLPVMLDNILVRQYSIQEPVAKNVAKTFKESAEYAGILVNGVISVAPDTATGDSDTGMPTVETEHVQLPLNPHTPSLSPQPAVTAAIGTLPVPIPNTDIVIHFPAKYAYNLSTGAFTEGIEMIAKNAGAVSANDEQPTTTTGE